MSVNQIILTGRTAKEVEVLQSKNGKSFVKFTIAVDRKAAKDSEGQKTDFVNCVAFGSTAEYLSKYCAKGEQITIAGELHIDVYTNDNKSTYYTNVVVHDAVLMIPKKEEKQNPKF